MENRRGGEPLSNGWVPKSPTKLFIEDSKISPWKSPGTLRCNILRGCSPVKLWTVVVEQLRGISDVFHVLYITLLPGQAPTNERFKLFILSWL